MTWVCGRGTRGSTELFIPSGVLWLGSTHSSCPFSPAASRRSVQSWPVCWWITWKDERAPPTPTSSPCFVIVLFFASSLWTCGSPTTSKGPHLNPPVSPRLQGLQGRRLAGLQACCVHEGCSGFASGWQLSFRFGMLSSPLMHLRGVHMLALSTGLSSLLLVKYASMQWQSSRGCPLSLDLP